MSRGVRSVALVFAVCCGVVVPTLRGQERPSELTAEQVKTAIARGTRYLVAKQNDAGSFGGGRHARFNPRVGPSALATLALLNSGLAPDDPVMARSLANLRGAKQITHVYESSLVLMALVAAKDWETDRPQITKLAGQLVAQQIAKGAHAGMWTYAPDKRFIRHEDNSNTQFAILGLREAALAGIDVPREIWEKTLDHFVKTQNGDGGWGYHAESISTGSMTCAGIASLVICDEMLGPSSDETDPDGTPRCCKRSSRATAALRKARAWLDENFRVNVNPYNGRTWVLYYLYGLERAGRLSGQRFFGSHDWYREGAAHLIDGQSPVDGSWSGQKYGESDPLVGSSFALLFLSKGLSPVLVNKLNYASARPRGGTRDELPNWNLHPNDARNLVEYVSELPKWPRLLTYQEVDLDKAVQHGGVADLLQAPILYISGLDEPKFTEPQLKLLRSFVEQGGFIFAVDNCNGAGFDAGIKNLVSQIYPPEAQLKRLPPEHAIYRSEFLLDPATTELWGVDFGCRTSFVYAPYDYSCLWDKWSLLPPPARRPAFATLVAQSMKVGTNVVAYVTGREPLDKLDARQAEAAQATTNPIERGLLQVAKLRHTGDWDAAPRALHNVLVALNEKSGALASTRQKNLLPGDPQLRRYPLAYLHGRESFQLGKAELENLRKYLSNGAVLFGDSCCGSPRFDKSFRELVGQLFPDKKLERIPVTHELYSTAIGFDLHKVKYRLADRVAQPGDASFQEGEPMLEGLSLNGRYCVIYSKYDLSCALERQSSVSCAGYEYHDAVRIAVNVIRYALLQDFSYAGKIK
jgi:hypothetical protein